MLHEDAWCSDLKMLGIDITIVPSATELSSSSISQPACSKELFVGRREGKKKKFCRDGKTDEQNVISYSGDEIMGLIEQDTMVLVPAVITPHDHTSCLLSRLLYGHGIEPHRIFRDRRNTNICEDSTRNTKVPHNILGETNSIWQASHPHKFFEVCIRQWTHAPVSTSPLR